MVWVTRRHRHDEKAGGRQGDHSTVVAIGAGSRFSAAVCYDGNVYLCGQNDKGQLGVGDRTARALPTRADFSQATDGHEDVMADREQEANRRRRDHLCCACETTVPTTSGVCAICGLALKDLYKEDNSAKARVDLFRHRVVVIGVACGAEHTACCSTNGELYTWGDNALGQLGLGDQVSRCLPARVRDALLGCAVTHAACGHSHTLCVAVERAQDETLTPTVFAWGKKTDGALGVPPAKGQASLLDALSTDDAASFSYFQYIKCCVKVGVYVTLSLSLSRKCGETRVKEALFWKKGRVSRERKRERERERVSRERERERATCVGVGEDCIFVYSVLFLGVLRPCPSWCRWRCWLGAGLGRSRSRAARSTRR